MLSNVTTKEDGLFYFKGFDLPDSTEILIQGNVHNSRKKEKRKKGVTERAGNKNVQFELLNLHELAFNENSTLNNIDFTQETASNFTEEITKIRQVDTIYHQKIDKPDYRTTLYWNPSMRLNKATTVSFDFYTGDKLAEFVIFVEGLTEDGQPFMGSTTFTVNNDQY